MGSLGHGQSLSGLGAHDLALLVLVGGDNPPFSVVLLVGLSLSEQFGDWALLLVLSQSLGLTILNTIEGEAVVLGGVTLLGNKDLVPWSTVGLTEANHLGGSLPVLVIGATTTVIDNLAILLVGHNQLSLTTEDSGGAVGLLALNALLLLLVVVLSLWAFVLGPAALLWVALEVTATGAWGSTLLVFILSMAWLVLSGVVLAWSGLADEASISQLKLSFLRRGGRGGGRRAGGG